MRVLPAFITVLVIIALDQWSKAAITSHLSYGESVPVIADFFNLVLVYNTGAAFSFLSGESGWQRWLFIGITVAAVGLIMWMIKTHRDNQLFCWGLTLILGGAVGNLIDRIRLGHVIDFLDFVFGNWHFWAFNIADSAITVGAALLILDSFRPRKTLAA